MNDKPVNLLSFDNIVFERPPTQHVCTLTQKGQGITNRHDLLNKQLRLEHIEKVRKKISRICVIVMSALTY